MQSCTYGTLPDSQVIIDAIDNSHYQMELLGDDLELMTRLTEQGIDSHLEAVHFHEYYADHKVGLSIIAKSMPVVLRRLIEYWESGDENAGDFASCILQTLDIEWV